MQDGVSCRMAGGMGCGGEVPGLGMTQVGGGRKVWVPGRCGRPEGGQLKGLRLGANLPALPPSARCGILPARSRVTS